MKRLHRGLATHRPPGIAQLVFDKDAGVYHCYWLAGRSDDHLVEHAQVATAAEAVAWAAARTPRARIRLPDHRTYWAGTGPNPGGFAGIWQAAPPTTSSTPYPQPATEAPTESRSASPLAPDRQAVGAGR
jgi:hypothetical protein